MSNWTLVLPWNGPLLTQNARPHWAKRNRLMQEMKHAAWALTKAAQVPRCEAITVQLHWRPTTRRTRDGDSCAPVYKALVDGITKAGVVIDDDHTHVTHLPLVVHEPDLTTGGMWLVISAVECDCYPSGFSPGTYEGPQEHCPVHGRNAEVQP